MKSIYNLHGIFHVTIITSFLLSLSGCGHKANPYYIEKLPEGDKNINFTITKPFDENHETNENR